MSLYLQAAERYAQRKPFGLFINRWAPLTLHTEYRVIDDELYFGRFFFMTSRADTGPHLHLDPPFTPTSKEYYLDSLRELIDSFTEPTDKTVIARKIVGSEPSAFENPEVFAKRLSDYFERFPNDFRFAFYTPETGLWVGASPELILVEEEGSDAYYTQALAGTRHVSDKSQAWSEKDCQEHQIVVDRIVRNLSPWQVKVGSTSDYTYGSISHLLTPIYITASPDDFCDILPAIYPTPAIWGNPYEAASRNIGKYERFRREFYTGLAGMENGEINVVYAALRCAHVADGKYEIFTGSGIVADSDPEAEWNETQAKAQPLLTFFKD